MEQKIEQTNTIKSKVNFREVKLYQSDDGRKIQVFKHLGEIESLIGNSPNLPFDPKDISEKYIGMNIVNHPAVGNRTISFIITGVSSVYEAFDSYDKFYKEAFEEDCKKVEKAIQDYMAKNPDAMVKNPNQGK